MADRMHDRQVTTDDGWEIRAGEPGDGLTIAGYIARFNEPTTISDFLGDYTERIAPGAFARTLAERGPAKVKMQYNHGHDTAFGSLPIGVWTSLRETRQGLWGEGRIHDNWHTLPIRAAIESGALSGMSFRFKPIAEQWRQGADGQPDERTLTELALFEAGPVASPAYETTTVGVRARALDLLRGEQRADEDAHDAPAESPCATMTEQRAAVAPVGDTEPDRAEADPPVGITRREMRIQALTRTGAIPHDPDRGAA